MKHTHTSHKKNVTLKSQTNIVVIVKVSSFHTHKNEDMWKIIKH